MTKDTNDSEWPKWLKRSAIHTAVLVFIVLVVYFFNFNNGFANQETFGQFGDFIGGLLNPILTFFTICLLIWSINIQLNELKRSTTALEKTQAAHEEMKKIQESALSKSDSQYWRQNILQTQDFRRREIMETMTYHFKRYEDLFKKPIVTINDKEYSLDKIYFDDEFKGSSLAGALADRIEKSSMRDDEMPNMLDLTVAEIKTHIGHLAEHYHELQDILQSPATKRSIKSRVTELINFNHNIGIYTKDEKTKILRLLDPTHADLGI